MIRSFLIAILAYYVCCFNNSNLRNNKDDLPKISLDLKRFMGRWYSIAHLPNFIEKFCKCTRTDDVLVEPLKIKLSESCLMFGFNITSVSYGIPETEGSGRWKNIQPLGPFSVKGDYWVIDVDENYQWACIGLPSKTGFWILSRTMEFDEILYQSIIEKARGWGFDVSKIERENMDGCQL